MFRGYRPEASASPYRALPGLAPACLSRLIAPCAPTKEDAVGIQRVIAGGRARPGEGHTGPCKPNTIILLSEPGKLRFGQAGQLTVSYAAKEWSGQALNLLSDSKAMLLMLGSSEGHHGHAEGWEGFPLE